MLCIAVHELLGTPQHNVKQNTTFYIGVYPRNLIVEAKQKATRSGGLAQSGG